MNNSVYLYKKIIAIVIFFLLLIAERSLPFIGIEKGISFYLILILYITKKDYFNEIFVFFFLGLIADLLSYEPFGFYVVVFVLLKILWDLINTLVPVFILEILMYFIIILLTNFLFYEISFNLLILSSVFILIYTIIYKLFLD